MEKRNTGLSIAGLVLGIIAIVFSFIPYINVISYITGILALIFGIVALVSKNSKKGLPIAAIILAIITFFIASNMNGAANKAIKDTSKELDKATGSSTEEVLKKDVQVTLGKFEATTDEYGITESQLVVTVKNITSKKQSYDFHIEAVDSSGKRVADDYVIINDLGPGQTTTEKIFKLVEN